MILHFSQHIIQLNIFESIAFRKNNNMFDILNFEFQNNEQKQPIIIKKKTQRPCAFSVRSSGTPNPILFSI